MLRRVVGTCSLALALGACVGQQAPQPDAQTAAQLDAAYACVVNTIKSAGYPVSKNARELKASGFIREEAQASEVLSRGGAVGGAALGSGSDFRDVPAPYMVDGVMATVSLDRKTGTVRIDAEAYTGSGITGRSGYVKTSASPRGAAVVRSVEACANDV